ncbi:MAG: hypothetical protein ACREDK_06015 [Thermoplasmata archaeon]
MPGPSAAGIPSAALTAVKEVLAMTPPPLRRRAILEELDRRGHRLSLAGLNRILDFCARSGWTREGPQGVQRAPDPT